MNTFTDAKRKHDLACFAALGQLQVVADTATLVLVAMDPHKPIARHLRQRVHDIEAALKAARIERDAVFAQPETTP